MPLVTQVVTSTGILSQTSRISLEAVVELAKWANNELSVLVKIASDKQCPIQGRGIESEPPVAPYHTAVRNAAGTYGRAPGFGLPGVGFLSNLIFFHQRQEN
jgi:hypothetical protein